MMQQYEHFHNKLRLTSAAQSAASATRSNLSDWQTAVTEIKTWPEYEPQPLWALSKHAERLSIGKLYYKDESQRFGTKLGSFKALGAPYAVYRLLAETVYQDCGQISTSAELRSGAYRSITQNVTVCAATDGNQGRGLAYGAAVFGCRCVTYIHEHVSDGRAQAMHDLGATVIGVMGDYGASAVRATEDALMNNWHNVSSTSADDFREHIPQHVMKAYMTIVEEAVVQLPAQAQITHVFVCGGVGSIAAAAFLCLYTHWADREMPLPRFIVVEPREADCLLESAKNGGPAPSRRSLSTLMAGLACRDVSPASFKILQWLASDFIAVADSMAVEGMKLLAERGTADDVPVLCGESSAASMGVLMEATRDSRLRLDLGLTEESQVLLFGLEGATDVALYEQLTGSTVDAVLSAQRRSKAAALV